MASRSWHTGEFVQIHEFCESAGRVAEWFKAAVLKSGKVRGV